MQLNPTFLRCAAAVLIVLMTIGCAPTAWAGDSGSCDDAKSALNTAGKRFELARDHRKKLSAQVETSLDRAQSASAQTANAPKVLDEAHTKYEQRIRKIVDAKTKMEDADAEKYEDRIGQAQDGFEDALKNEDTAYASLEKNEERLMNATDEFISALQGLARAKKEEQHACR